MKLYTRISALFLIIAYLFIAIPVFSWHDHTTSSPRNHLATGLHFTVALENDFIHCSACEHKYSVYVTPTLATIGLSICSFLELRSKAIVFSEQIYYRLNQNKGPPKTPAFSLR